MIVIMIGIMKNLMSDNFMVMLQDFDNVDYCNGYGDSNGEEIDPRKFQGDVVESNIDDDDYYHHHHDESNDEEFDAGMSHGDVVEISIAMTR